MSSKRVLNAQLKQRNSVSSNGSSSDSRKSRTLPQLGSSSAGHSRTAPIYTSDEFDNDEDTLNDSQAKMKTMFMSMWNNVKYGFTAKLKTNFNYESPIWLLGMCYHKRLDSSRDDNQSKATAMDKFRHDFFSRIWFTYRKEFPKLANSHLTTDCGWGCMLRSGQMMLAQAFLIHYLGRQWRWNGPQSDKEDMIHRMIIKWFADEPSSISCPFSVHQLVSIGECSGKKPGDWYGPASVAHLLRAALVNASANNPVLGNICCYVAQDCTVYIEDVIDLCTSNSVGNRKNSCGTNNFKNILSKESSEKSDEIEVGKIADENINFGSSFVIPTSSLNSPTNFNFGKAPSTFNLTTDISYSSSGPRSLPFSSSAERNDSQQKWRGLILLVPVRLGGEKLNPIYISCVKQLLSHPSCLGIIGGKPKHSLYFVGWQDDKLIYIDPHYCQQAVDVRQANFPLDSFHNNYPRKTQFTNMDPSCTIGFYCQNGSEFYEFISTVQELITPPNQGTDYPMFVFNQGSNSMSAGSLEETKNTDILLRVKHRYVNSRGKVEKEVHTDEFVVL